MYMGKAKKIKVEENKYARGEEPVAACAHSKGEINQTKTTLLKSMYGRVYTCFVQLGLSQNLGQEKQGGGGTLKNVCYPAMCIPLCGIFSPTSQVYTGRWQDVTFQWCQW
jgi:hypothetical protein